MSKMREVKGYMTIEMSLILPIVCFLLVVLISFFFYCMDYGILKGIVQEENLKATDVVKTNGKVADGTYSLETLNSRNVFYLLHPSTTKIQKATKQKIKERIASKIMLGKVQSISVKMTSKKITTKVVVDVKIPILGSIQAAGIHLFRMKVEEVDGVYMEAESVRRWDIIDSGKDEARIP